jgi:DNA-binding PadR family transcriptional regulator
VKTQWVDSGVGHAHKLYELTEQGRRSCVGMIAAWNEMSSGMDQLMKGKVDV